MSTLADRYFQVDMDHARLRDAIGDVLDASLPGWDDFTADYYDNSIEVYGAALETIDGRAKPEAIAALKAAGFSVVWVHPHPMSDRRVDGKLCRCPAT